MTAVTAPIAPSTSFKLDSMTMHPDLHSEGAVEWDWDIEHEDRKREREADTALHNQGATSSACAFEVDRRVLKDVVREKMGVEVGRIRFLSAGTFHKAYLITLSNRTQLVARVARRFMPRLKTESEVATIQWLQENTNVPVPTIYHYDSNPYNRLGGEWILMSKAPGIPLSKVYHSMSYPDLTKLLRNLIELFIPLFAHRFAKLGSLYFGPDPNPDPDPVELHPNLTGGTADELATTPHPPAASVSSGSNSATPRAPNAYNHYTGYPFSPTLSGRSSSSSSLSSIVKLAPLKGVPAANGTITSTGPSSDTATASGVVAPASSEPPPPQKSQLHIGPIISWPFFGSNRGDLSHPDEINRGPWSTTSSYLTSCTLREISSVILENEGKAAPHKLHLDPAEIWSSHHHRVRAVEGDESDDSDEWGLEESEEEWEGPGDAMYRDYRRMQRGTFLVSEIKRREDVVRKEMGRWNGVMERLVRLLEQEVVAAGVGTNERKVVKEEFALDCHDLSLENVFVDEEAHHKITCIIDWESTTTRPLWACAHLPAFLQSSPFTAKLFRDIVSQIANSTPGQDAQTVSKASPNTNGRSRTNKPPAALPLNPEPALPIRSSTSSTSATTTTTTFQSLAREWLLYESAGTRLRMAHRFVEWDGWEEGLCDELLGSEEHEEEWYRSPSHGHGPLTAAGTGWKGRGGLDSAPLGSAGMMMRGGSLDGYGMGGGLGLGMAGNGAVLMSPNPVTNAQSSKLGNGFVGLGPSGGVGGLGSTASGSLAVLPGPQATNGKNVTTTGGGRSALSKGGLVPSGNSSDSLLHAAAALTRKTNVNLPSKMIAEQLTKGEKMLNTTGDFCGGRGGELGRRLEAWLVTSSEEVEGDADVDVDEENEGKETDSSEHEADVEDEGERVKNEKVKRPVRLKRWITTDDMNDADA